MPNVGKSTTFNLMCSMSVPAENFPVGRGLFVPPQIAPEDRACG